MKPAVVCLMVSSLDGGLHQSRYTRPADGDTEAWDGAFEALHDELGGDAWIVGRVTMGEMSKAGAHPPQDLGSVERPVHVAASSGPYGIAIDTGGKLHFDGDAVGGDKVVVLLGPDVPDSHLAELVADGVSYVVAENDPPELDAFLMVLRKRFGIERLLLEGGGTINGQFLAQGLVDEFHVLMLSALDGNATERIVQFDDGLQGRIALKLEEVRQREAGIVHLRYAVNAV